MTSKKIERLLSKDSTELIVYQIGEVKNLLENMTIKFDNYKDITDKRITELEKHQATQIARSIDQPKLDIQKIILAAFSLVSTVLAIALGIDRAQ